MCCTDEHMELIAGANCGLPCGGHHSLGAAQGLARALPTVDNLQLSPCYSHGGTEKVSDTSKAALLLDGRLSQSLDNLAVQLVSSIAGCLTADSWGSAVLHGFPARICSCSDTRAKRYPCWHLGCLLFGVVLASGSIHLLVQELLTGRMCLRCTFLRPTVTLALFYVLVLIGDL